jgi:hypothetical protein
LIPGSLESLPAKQIGSAVPTDQVALQDFKSVWVNQEIFDAMSEKDQANLLLHEILMGVKLLRFESEQNQCFSTSVEKLKCLQLYKPGASVALTDQDYHEIRRTVAEIMGYTEIVPGVEVEDLFAKNEFSFPLREYFLKEDILTNSTYKLFEQLQSSYFSDEYFASTYVGDDQQVPAYTGPCGSGRPELRDNVLYIYLMPMLKVKDSYVASMSLMKLVYNQTNQNGDDSLRTITMWGTWQHTNSSGEWVDSQVEAQFVMLNQRFRSLIISVDGQRISCEYGK